jgi:hypothetical protein
MSWNTNEPSRVKPLVASGTSFPGGSDQALVDLARLALAEAERKSGYRMRDGWCWGYAYRPIAGTSTLSYHGRSGGRAVDVNAPENGRGSRGEIPMSFVRVMEENGFTWGGRWDYQDDMHFEYHGSAKSARRRFRRLNRQLGAEHQSFVYRVGDEQFRKLDRAMAAVRAKLKTARAKEAERKVHVELVKESR